MIETKLHWFPGIVGYGFSADIDIAHRELIARPNNHAACEPFEFPAGRCASSEKHGQIMGFGGRHHPATMITMLMFPKVSATTRVIHTTRALDAAQEIADDRVEMRVLP